MNDFLEEGCPSVHARPRDRNDGTVFSREAGPDRLLDRLREVHEAPRYDIPPELERHGVAR